MIRFIDASRRPLPDSGFGTIGAAERCCYIFRMLAIRHAIPDDAQAVSNLLVTSTREHIAADCTTGGLDQLLETMTMDSVRDRMNAGFAMWVAADADQLVGVCALRRPAHLYHLFVATDFQKQGIGRKLLDTAIRYCQREAAASALTVNASSFGVPAYLRLGFALDGPRKDDNGVRYQPMRLCLQPPKAARARGIS